MSITRPSASLFSNKYRVSYVFSNINEMLNNVEMQDGDIIEVLGSVTEGDGGRDIFRLVPSGTFTTNNETIFDLIGVNTLQAARIKHRGNYDTLVDFENALANGVKFANNEVVVAGGLLYIKNGSTDLSNILGWGHAFKDLNDRTQHLFSGDGVTTTFIFPPGTIADSDTLVDVFISGLSQDPSAFTFDHVSDPPQITFSGTPDIGTDNIRVVLLQGTLAYDREIYLALFDTKLTEVNNAASQVATDAAAVAAAAASFSGGGNSLVAPKVVGARYHWSSYSAATNQWAKPPLTTQHFDTDAFGTVANRLTIPTGVDKIRLTMHWRENAATSADRKFGFIKNGAASPLEDEDGASIFESDSANTGEGGITASTGILSVMAGDYFEPSIYQSQSGQWDGWLELEVLEGTLVNHTVPVLGGTKLPTIVPSDAGKLVKVNPTHDGYVYEDEVTQTGSAIVSIIDAHFGNTDWRTSAFFKGVYTSIGALTTAYPTGQQGWFAFVDSTVPGEEPLLYAWDNEDQWSVVAGSGGPFALTGADIESTLDAYFGNTIWKTHALSDAPNDGKKYHRFNNTWIEDTGISDAPTDGKKYHRKDGVWIEDTGGTQISLIQKTSNFDIDDTMLIGGIHIECPNSSIITVPKDLTGTEPLRIEATGSETVRFLAGTGVVLKSLNNNTKLEGENAIAILTPKGNNVYTLSGDLVYFNIP